MSSLDFDVVVLGAGSAGSAAAYQIARRGLSVAVLDSRARDKAGARWVDAIPPWMFEAAGLEDPQEPELIEEDGILEIRAWNGDRGVTLGRNPLWNIDMRHLVERLQRLSLDAGVTFFDRVTSIFPECASNGRPVRLRFARKTASGEKHHDLSARLFIDATGLNRALLDQLPLLRRHCPAPTMEDCCQAAQVVCDIDDPDAARAFFESQGLTPGDSLSWIAVVGGYSTLGVHIEEGLSRIGILAGADATGRRASGSDLLQRFREQHSWIGKTQFGGNAIIPLRRPYARLGGEGVALLGNVACQVFPAHGSGVGASLIAARQLAESISRFDDPGCAEAVWAYQARFHRGQGALHVAYDIIRRMSADMTNEQVQRMVQAGLMSGPALNATLLQFRPELSLGDVLDLVKGVAREPLLAGKLGPWMARFPALYLAAQTYPAKPDLEALRHWAAFVAYLADSPSDMPAPAKKGPRALISALLRAA